MTVQDGFNFAQGVFYFGGVVLLTALLITFVILVIVDVIKKLK